MLYIQDPSFAASKQLLDAILECCPTARFGAGAYAFVSADGINLLIGDPVFTAFLKHGQFLLIVGMDEITNTRSLATINHYMTLFPNLQVKAFLHNTTGSTFHPKFCWFDCGDHGFVITGSGNLTQKGMQRNREAFEAKTVNSDELAVIVQYWNSWLESVSAFLLPLDDEAVVQRAEENIHRMQVVRPRRARVVRRPRTEVAVGDQATAPEDNPTEEETTEQVTYVDDELGSWEYDITSAVLICEIPRGGGRWNQANFDAATFQSFFESTPGVSRQMALILRDVKRDGSLGEIKHRPPVSVASQNYRIELVVNRGTIYPPNGRVLGVFVKLSARTFLYSLVFPSYAEYPALQAKMDSERKQIGRMVRYQTNAEELQRLAPSLPLLQYLSQAD